MKKLILAAGLAVSLSPVFAEPMMKAGLWEMHIDKQIMDGQDMSAQMAAAQAEMKKALADMPPAQRKQMEQAMGGLGMGGSPNSHRICISPEMAAQDKLPVADNRCQPSKYQRSGNKTVFELNCPGMVGKGESIVSGDSITSKMDMTMTDQSGKHTLHSESRMKYLGADCQGIKPADQIARDMQARQQGRMPK